MLKIRLSKNFTSGDLSLLIMESEERSVKCSESDEEDSSSISSSQASGIGVWWEHTSSDHLENQYFERIVI